MRHEIRNRIQTAGAQGYEGASRRRKPSYHRQGGGDDLAGDVKKLTNFAPEYRLRVGNYRVLFEVDHGTVTVCRVRHRKDAYS